MMNPSNKYPRRQRGVVLFISLIELLVAGIQAYVFTLFTSLYIGLAVEEHHGDGH